MRSAGLDKLGWSRQARPTKFPRPAKSDRPAKYSRTAKPSTVIVAGVLGAALVASVVLAVTFGPADITAGEVWASVLHHLGLGTTPLSELRDGIVWELRMPRVLTAAAVGAGLAVSGAVRQALTRNPLAGPYLLGLSSGASLGAGLVLLLGLALALPVAAFLGALLALGLTL